MDAEVLLCDFAEAINGKLYISGGGWATANLLGPLRCAMAIRLAVSWSEANTPHDLRVSLRNQDGEQVQVGDGPPVLTEGKFEVGRPPGLVQGEDLVNCMVVNYEGLDLPGGQYVFHLEIDGNEIARASFRINRIGAPVQ